MYREAIDSLKKWKERTDRKPLVIKGARQVGKTWLVTNFGEDEYSNLVYVNFDRETSAKDVFELDYDPERIITRLSIYANQEITKGKTLIFLDEIQECPRALEALKYFTEEAPEYHIIVAGSLLGVYLHEGFSFPVGKVDFLDVFPLNFGEFLRAMGEAKLEKSFREGDSETLGIFHDKLLDYYKTYLVTGGMPAVVQRYKDTGSLLEARQTQHAILEAYGRDFSKHAPASEVPRINDIFNVVPSVLAKENKKFMFGAIRESARAREYEAALLWLMNAGIVAKVERINKLRLPLAAYASKDAFKLFYIDVGLLGCKAGVRPEVIFEENPFFTEFKGAIAEQFVFQELKARGMDVYYYAKDDSRSELDFVVDTKDGPTPIEVKSGKVLASKSLNLIMNEHVEIRRAYKMSVLGYQENERIVNLPIYLAGLLATGSIVKGEK